MPLFTRRARVGRCTLHAFIVISANATSLYRYKNTVLVHLCDSMLALCTHHGDHMLARSELHRPFSTPSSLWIINVHVSVTLMGVVGLDFILLRKVDKRGDNTVAAIDRLT